MDVNDVIEEGELIATMWKKSLRISVHPTKRESSLVSAFHLKGKEVTIMHSNL